MRLFSARTEQYDASREECNKWLNEEDKFDTFEDTVYQNLDDLPDLLINLANS